MDLQSTLSTSNNKSLSRREREKLAHRQEIMDAATRIFAKKGYSNATLDEIAQEAEFSKGTLYLYFSNKEDLMYSIMKEKIVSFWQMLKSTLAGKSSFREELHELFKKLAEVAFKETDFFLLVITQHVTGFKSISLEKAQEIVAVHEVLDEIIFNRAAKAIEDGELREIDPRAIYGVIHGASENMMFNKWDCKTLKELQNAVDIFMDILFEGIERKKEACCDA